MAREDVHDKLAFFLPAHRPMAEECHVVYALVEMRKIIDHEGSAPTYPFLKFFADWAVRTRKDAVTPAIADAVGRIYRTVAEALAAPHPTAGAAAATVGKLAFIDALRRETSGFLGVHEMNTALVDDEEQWVAFVALLVRVLESQPITDPTAEVASLAFEPAGHRSAIATMTFKSPIGERDSYRFGNTY